MANAPTDLESSTLDATLPQDPTRRPRVPWFLWLLIGFLGIDTLLQLFQMGSAGAASSLRQFIQLHFEHLVASTFSLLLIVQILLRSITARIWGSGYFLLQIFYIVAKYSVWQPEDWVAATPEMRVQILMRALFFAAALMLINSRPNSTALQYR